MSEGKLILPENYENRLDYVATEIAIKNVKDLFERRLAYHLNLMRVSAPLFVRKDSGLNDNLNGVERPVTFDIRNIEGDVEIVVHREDALPRRPGVGQPRWRVDADVTFFSPLAGGMLCESCAHEVAGAERVSASGQAVQARVPFHVSSQSVRFTAARSSGDSFRRTSLSSLIRPPPR